VPRVRRLANSKVRPVLRNIWTNVKAIATEPRKIVYIAAGSVLAQLLVAAALGASLHAVGQQASLATILVVMTLASIIGGAVPVPGGLGVVEAGLIAGLTAAGPGRRGGVHPADVHRLPAADLGLGHARLDAPPRIRVIRRIVWAGEGGRSPRAHRGRPRSGQAGR